MIRPLRRAVVTTLAGVLMLTVGACSGQGTAGPPDAAAIVRDAAARTAAAGARITITGSGPARGRQVRTTGTGVVDPAHRAAALDLAVDPVGGVQARILGSTAYAALPPATTGDLGQGRPWVSVDLAAVDPGLFADTLIQLGTGVTGNPADGLTLLGVADDVRDAGPDAVGTVGCTRYTGVVDLARAAGATPALAPMLQRFTSDVSVSRLPVGVWVDRSGRVRRLTEDLSTTATSTVDLDDPTPPAPVAAPPATHVTDLLESLRS